MEDNARLIRWSGVLKTELIAFGQSRQYRRSLEAFHRFRAYELRDEEGRSAAERSAEESGRMPEMPPVEIDSDLAERETVGLICDELEGLNLYPDFGAFEETFAAPQLASDRWHRELVLGYLEGPTISPLPLLRMAERNPEHATEVFRQVLRRRKFAWERDGQALLRKYKARHFEKPPLPSVVPVSSSSTPELPAERERKPAPAKRSKDRNSRHHGKKSKR